MLKTPCGVYIIPMETNRTHKIRLSPTFKQRTMLNKTAGTVRYAYNWALTEWNKIYETYKQDKTRPKPSAYTLSRQWTKDRPEWSREVNRGSQTKAILNLGQAFINFWNGHAKCPVYKKKGRGDSFYIPNDKARIKGKTIRIPNVGWIKTREQLRYQGKIMSYTVVKEADQWFVCVQCSVNIPKVKTGSVIGVDVGIHNLAVTSEDEVLENPKNLKRSETKLRRLQKKLSRQKKGSKRRYKTKIKIAKTYLNIRNKGRDLLHKFTHQVTKNHGTVVIEDLDLISMRENKYLRRPLHEASLRELLLQLGYKASELIKAPRYFPSSKRCSKCGKVKENLKLSERIFRCTDCSFEVDRDLNAARNLMYTPWVTG